MHENRFDTLARGLARGSSRRSVLGGAFGVTFALLTGSSALADRGRLRRARNNSRGQDEPASVEGVQPGGVLDGGILEASLAMCHFDSETGNYRVVPVSTLAVPERLERGDTLFIDCCVDSECGWRPCLEAKGCVSGACAYEATVNAACALENGTTGICRSDAVCVPGSPGAEVAAG